MTRIENGVRPAAAGGGLRPARGDLWRDWGGEGPVLHLAHANGFPPGTYRKLAGVLQDRFHVMSMGARPLWSNDSPRHLHDWSQLADDLRRELTGRQLRGAVAVGHSLGAVTSLLAAVEDPGLFRAIVAVDPLVLTGRWSVLWGLAKRIGLAGRLGLVRGARSRRDLWPDRATARMSYERKAIFRGWDPEVLDDYLDQGLAQRPDGRLGLRYPKTWEARIFEVAPHNLWPRLRRLTVPTLFIQGERSDTFVNGARARVERQIGAASVAVIRGASHFVPMECPDELGRLALEFLGATTDTTREGV